MSSKKEISDDKKLKGTENFSLWFDYIKWEITKEGLMGYIKENKIQNIDVENPATDQHKNILKNNAKARSILVEAMSAEVHKEVIGINSAYDVLQKLKKKYEGDDTNITYWIKRLNSLKAKDKKSIPDVLDRMKDMFTKMGNKDINMSENEKLKFLYAAIPRDYLKKFVLDKDEDFDSLVDKIEGDLSKFSVIENWVESEREYEPMEVDFVQKDLPENKNRKNKHCDICKGDKQHTHNTSECWFNLKNKNSKYTKQWLNLQNATENHSKVGNCNKFCIQ